MRKCFVNCLYDICSIFFGICYLCDDGYKGFICDNGIYCMFYLYLFLMENVKD